MDNKGYLYTQCRNSCTEREHSMNLGFKGKAVVVTAASGGLGREIAKEFAAEGANVVLAARNEERLARAVDDIEKATGNRPTGYRADCTNEQDIKALVHDTVRDHGRLDVMICNSIGPRTAPFDEMTDDLWREALDVKVIAQIRCAREAFRAMKSNRSGCILFMAGTHGRQPRSYSVTAGVSNAALINASKVLSEVAAPFNIRVNAINPGPIETDRMVYLVKEKATELGVSEAEAKRILADVTVLKRFGTTEEIAAATVFLASSRASFITGTMLDVDGGQVQAI
jgi:NAD(P)-dependent dehydrogenase (short-subunit alcohol dehydrogenase family)